jgi:subtilisin family serine protease
VAPAARLLSIRVTDADATSDLFTLAQAIVAATNAGARVINVSLGGYATGPALDGAIGYALQNGALVVAAAGNDQAAQLAWPAADPRVISVGAIDRLEQQVLFSNSGTQLKLSAPGYGVQTAWLDAQRVTVDGTSASAPLVSGALATLLSLDPNLTPAQAAGVLFRTANDTGRPGVDPAFGYGVLNLATALNARNPSYVDTAIASQFYDDATQTVQFVVQNRSGRTVSGLTLNVDTWGAKSQHPVAALDAGATQVVVVPVTVKAATLQAAGRLVYTSQLVNPAGLVDAAPANNQRAGVLVAPVTPQP